MGWYWSWMVCHRVENLPIAVHPGSFCYLGYLAGQAHSKLPHFILFFFFFLIYHVYVAKSRAAVQACDLCCCTPPHLEILRNVWTRDFHRSCSLSWLDAFSLVLVFRWYVIELFAGFTCLWCHTQLYGGYKMHKMFTCFSWFHCTDVDVFAGSGSSQNPHIVV
jgi:hypothetical protein